MTPLKEERGKHLTQVECHDIVRRVSAFAHGGYTSIVVQSWLNGELRWARNRVNLASDRCDLTITIRRDSEIGMGSGSCITNQMDDASLEGAVLAAERRCKEHTRLNMWVDTFSGALKSPDLTTPVTAIWSDVTAIETGETRGRLARMLTEEAEAKKMLSAGYLEARSGSFAFWSNTAAKEGKLVPGMLYQQLTQNQCSMTVRHPRGTGSGWAGASSFDATAVDGAALARHALDKCIASIDPVRIEPGRYTVILEPQAANGLIDLMMEPMVDMHDLNTLLSGMDGRDILGPLARKDNENPIGPMPFYLTHDEALQIGRSKLGLKVIDERITISHDPIDPVLGVVPRPGLKPITLIQNGVLMSLYAPHTYATEQVQRLSGDLYRPSFRVSGGISTIEDMIATTKRGLLITRFSGIQRIDGGNLLGTGTTRDGLWLIENGTISKAVLNMRFTESPLFALNQVEQLGIPQAVFRPVKNPTDFSLTPAVVPSMKINDFSFTSLVDAV